MDRVSIVFVTFGLVVFGTGMSLAIKWRDDKQESQVERRAVLIAAGKVAAAFLLRLLVLGLFTFFLVRKLGLDMTLP